jgi:hypothetical protein
MIDKIMVCGYRKKVMVDKVMGITDRERPMMNGEMAAEDEVCQAATLIRFPEELESVGWNCL